MKLQKTKKRWNQGEREMNKVKRKKGKTITTKFRVLVCYWIPIQFPLSISINTISLACSNWRIQGEVSSKIN